jgi:DNA-binding response OmpR family regulator
MSSGSYPAFTQSDIRCIVGDIEIDDHMREVRRAGVEVKLTPKEYDLLIALARRKGAAASKQALMYEVWNTTAETNSRTLDQHIFELRRKLEPTAGQPRHIVTVSKFGYRLRINE